LKIVQRSGNKNSNIENIPSLAGRGYFGKNCFGVFGTKLPNIQISKWQAV